MSRGPGAQQLSTLKKKKSMFSSYIRKFRVEQLQSHKWLTASSYMGKYLRISSYIRKPLLIYDFANAPLWISLCIRQIWFSFLSVYEFRNSRIKVGHDDDLSNLFERINPPQGEGGEEEWHKDSTGLTRLWLWSFWHGVDISVYMCICVSSPGPDEQAYIHASVPLAWHGPFTIRTVQNCFHRAL